MSNPFLLRQSFLGRDSDTILNASRVGIVGLGGGGSHIAQQLAHIGVGRFALCDPQRIEDTNLNRLVGATRADIEQQTTKVTIAGRVILNINPAAEITPVAKPWQADPEVLRECDVIIGCLDSFRARDELERLTRRFLIPYIDIGMDVHALEKGYLITGQVAVSMPAGPCLWCMGLITEELLSEEAGQYGAAGGRPQVIWPNGILASTAVGLFVQLNTPWGRTGVDALPILLEYDGNVHTVVPSNKLKFLKRRRCPHHQGFGDPFFKIQSLEENNHGDQNNVHQQGGRLS